MPRNYKAMGLLGAKIRWANEPPPTERFFSDVRGDPGACWEWKGALTNTGYGKRKFRGRTVSAHRVAWILSRGSIPDGICVLHRCDNKRCVNPSHLFLGTQKDNTQDAAAKGRLNPPRGERQTRRKLSKKDVLKIRQLIKDGQGQVAVARLFGVNQTTISNIKTGKRWKDT